MTTTRRQFLQHSALATGGLAALLSSLQKAAAIAPAPGSNFRDAEHVVILMQENRSFDHTFGSLNGVRGFSDPRAVKRPDGAPVWVQAETTGEHHVPFRLDMNATRATWMGSLPHSWSNQVDAARGGHHDGWLAAKRSGNPLFGKMPLTLGFHTREDIPFYYALADAFTVCDQNFSSALTGTTPNRLHLWTGTIRGTPDGPALVRNEECDYGRWQKWTTFPERLEDAGVSWKVYQNELSISTGLDGEQDAWLANFSDNPLEWFEQYGVRFSANYQRHIAGELKKLPKLIADATAKLPMLPEAEAAKVRKQIQQWAAKQDEYEKDTAAFSAAKFDAWPERNRNLHRKAFDSNAGDPHYRELAKHNYLDNGKPRTLTVPKGDVLFQFRKDVQEGKLPAVSWLVPPENYSDHPSSAWYGQWYLSEVLEILTQDPAVWAKTIFILTYDENDGYYDHVPPFQPPHPDRPATGKASAGLDTRAEHVDLEADRKRVRSEARGNAIGLGFRVPMVIASPWSRGGRVCSQVFDHTSVVQFMEKWLAGKTARPVMETNITAWRRAVCGDLTSAFHAGDAAHPLAKSFVNHEAEHERIHKAKSKELPEMAAALSAEELKAIRTDARHPRLPNQEAGPRPSCALPYELTVDGNLTADGKNLNVRFAAGNTLFKDRAAGAAFIAYAHGNGEMTVRHYTVAAGSSVEDTWPAAGYDIRIHGPNGFYREFKGGAGEPRVNVSCRPTPAGDVELTFVNPEAVAVTIAITDPTYSTPAEGMILAGSDTVTLTRRTQSEAGWHDVMVSIGATVRRFAGRVETGVAGVTDPALEFRS
jgi:phospholipase C